MLQPTRRKKRTILLSPLQRTFIIIMILSTSSSPFFSSQWSQSFVNLITKSTHQRAAVSSKSSTTAATAFVQNSHHNHRRYYSHIRPPPPSLSSPTVLPPTHPTGTIRTVISLTSRKFSGKRTTQQVRPIFAVSDDHDDIDGGIEKSSVVIPSTATTKEGDTTSKSSIETAFETTSQGEDLNVTAKESKGEVSSSMLAIDPTLLEIEIKNDDEDDDQTTGSKASSSLKSASMAAPGGLGFVSMFRGSANYIANHRNTLAVYHIPGELLEWKSTPSSSSNSSSISDASGSSSSQQIFKDLMDDIALTWLLGMKIVIVSGCRYQINQRLSKKNREKHFGMAVTDEQTLRIVKEEAGYVRFEIERQLARSLRLHGGLGAKTRSSYSGGAGGGGGYRGMGYRGNSRSNSNELFDNSHEEMSYDGNVVSGNFYSAQPFGVLDGIDYKYTGFVRRVEVQKIRDVHASRDICLLTTLGVSPSGEVFNVNSEALAARVAGSLEASKIIYFTEKEMILRNKQTNKLVQNMRLSDVQNLLTYNGVEMNKKGFANIRNMSDDDMFTMSGIDDTAADSDDTNLSPKIDFLLKLGYSLQAVEGGVKRAHIITPKQGSLLQELYTRDGSGTLISRDLYEGIRRATVNDVSGISDLIQPLINMGTLVDRPKAVLERDINSYFVYTRDALIVACGQLKRFENGYAEIGCLVVHKDYRKGGRGDAMLGYLERLCVQSSATRVFVLSTQTMEWFLERGFQSVTVDRLPPSRQQTYNYERKSKIYLKEIQGDRDLDAQELWWNR